MQGDREEVKREERFFYFLSVAVGITNCSYYGCCWSYWVLLLWLLLALATIVVAFTIVGVAN